MQIEVKGSNLQVTDEMRENAERRFDKIAKQVSNSRRSTSKWRTRTFPATRWRLRPC